MDLLPPSLRHRVGFQAHLELCGRCRGEAGLCTCGSPGQVTGGEGPVCLSLSTPGFRGSGCTLSPGLLSRASLPFGLMDAPMLIARRSPVLSSCCRLLLLRCLGSSRCHATVKGTAPVGPLFVHHPCRPSPLAPSPSCGCERKGLELQPGPVFIEFCLLHLQ